MPNITVVTTTNTFQVNFGDYSNMNISTIGIIPQLKTYQKSNIEIQKIENKIVILFLTTSEQFPISYQESEGCFVVDEIDSIIPSSDDNLYTLIQSKLG